VISSWAQRLVPKSLLRLAQNLATTGRSKKQFISVLADAAAAIFALWLAFSLRHNQPFTDLRSTWYLFVIIAVGTAAIFAALGVYKWVIRSTNRFLLSHLLIGCIAASGLLIFAVFLLPPDRIMARSLFIIFGMLLFLCTCSSRYIWQSFFAEVAKGEPIAVYGAGETGQLLVHSLVMGGEFRPVLFLDDDKQKTDTVIAGIRVLNASRTDLASQLNKRDINKVILALPSSSAAQYHNKIAQLESMQLEVKTTPSLAELVSGVASVEEVRNVEIADILGRSEVAPDDALLGLCVTGKTVLVTGGGGSIGSELCRQILLLQPKKLLVLDISEPNLYSITESIAELSKKFDLSTDLVTPILCSVLDQTRIDRIIQEENVDTIYHAAAYKHVPIIEHYPEQGVEVNVLGTKTVLDSAVRNKVKNFVLISTDKAVRPTNAMGCTKRVAELILQAKAMENPTTRISMVRFGNVLDSSGSVVPKFRKQIESGGPITLTHLDITRYFMTIPEAAQLVLQASAISKGGDVFVLDMGQPIRIEDLAITMVSLYGKKLKRNTGNDADIDIVVQGLRPGEKLYEELFIDDSHKKTMVEKVFTANEYSLTNDELNAALSRLKAHLLNADRKKLREELLVIAHCGTNAAHNEVVQEVPKVKTNSNVLALADPEVYREAIVE